MTAARLPIPHGDPILDALFHAWPDPARWPYRSRWLHDFEQRLRELHPGASSDELTLTARLAAPFPLAKPGVP